MSKVVERSVAVTDPDTHETHWFHKGDKLPAWADKLVTNERVFTPEGGKRGQGGDEEPEFEDSMVETSSTTDYSRMNKAKLEALLDDRGLEVGGTKPELVKRLEASDAATG